jgi:ElaB/YqjD/DUF883 family membrane-anchored ribosome-binding protein
MTTRPPLSSTLIASHLFTQQTGTAIATELLYRILIDIINRLLSSFQHLAARGMDEASTWMQQKLQERRDRLDSSAKENASDSTSIMQEVEKLAELQGFITCPLTTGHAQRQGRGAGPMGPPMWIRSVLKGIDEGRMSERDFWIQTHGE